MTVKVRGVGRPPQTQGAGAKDRYLWLECRRPVLSVERLTQTPTVERRFAPHRPPGACSCETARWDDGWSWNSSRDRNSRDGTGLPLPPHRTHHHHHHQFIKTICQTHALT